MNVKLPTSASPPIEESEQKLDRLKINRAKILAAATLEFSKDGVKGAKVDTIAASSGLSKRTLYKHFTNKEAIFNGILDDFIASMDHFAAISYVPDRAFDNQLRSLIEVFIQAFYDEDYLQQARVITCEILKGRQISEERMASCNVWKDHLSWWITRAREDQHLSSTFPSEEIAVQFFEIMKAETFYPLLYRAKANTDENREQSIDRLTTQFREYYASA